MYKTQRVILSLSYPYPDVTQLEGYMKGCCKTLKIFSWCSRKNQHQIWPLKNTNANLNVYFIMPKKVKSCSGFGRVYSTQGADPPPLPLRVAKAGRNQLNEEIIPLLPTGLGKR